MICLWIPENTFFPLPEKQLFIKYYFRTSRGMNYLEHIFVNGICFPQLQLNKLSGLYYNKSSSYTLI